MQTERASDHFDTDYVVTHVHSTKEEVVQKFGIPDAIFRSKEKTFYVYEATGDLRGVVGLVAVVPPFFIPFWAPEIEDEATHCLALVFDDKGFLQEYMTKTAPEAAGVGAFLGFAPPVEVYSTKEVTGCVKTLWNYEERQSLERVYPRNISDEAKWFCPQADDGIADPQRRIGDLLYYGYGKTPNRDLTNNRPGKQSAMTIYLRRRFSYCFGGWLTRRSGTDCIAIACHRACGFLMLLGALGLLSSTGTADSASLLPEKYPTFLAHVQARGNSFPFYIESARNGDNLRADVYVKLDYPVSLLAELLTLPRVWCEFMPLNLNIKACTYRVEDAQSQLRLYAGRKFYQTPAESYLIQYKFQVTKQQKENFRVALTATEGPFGSSDYVISVEAISVDSRSFVRVHVSYDTSLWSQLLTSGYLATLGAGKVGFTIIERTAQGKPVYVEGLRSITERNAMRYYLAMLAYLETLTAPAEQRFDARTERWFGLTEQYHKQLHELDRVDYLEAKRRERQNQLALQAAIDREGKSDTADSN
jgi:hypothetical protein